jgi:hypothetical protein
MKREDDQQLWDLLGHAAEPRLSPFFARNVCRIVRNRSQAFGSVRGWLGLRRLIPAAGLAATVITAILMLHHPGARTSTEAAPEVVAKIDPQDYDVVADLDELLVTNESSLWDDDISTL